jgi:transcriptional regulator with XRE-family HTH domain
MTMSLTYEEYEAARQTSAMLADEFIDYSVIIEQDPWLSVLKPAYSGSAGIVMLMVGYGPILPHVGSSSSIVDHRLSKRTPKLVTPEASADFRKVVALSVVEQMQELLAALSLNKSQLAQILRVTRPTIYDWFQGKDPSANNMERLHALLGVLSRATVSGVNPLSARFVRQPTDLDAPSLIEMLSEEQLDEERVLHTIEQVRALGDSASRRRTTREDRLRALGFEDPSDEQRREQLAKNVALQDWPKR